MSTNYLYTDLSCYYDLMCADINYQAQSSAVHRLHQLFGNSGTAHLDLACGTGPHVRHFLDFGYRSQGLDINQPMLDIAGIRCPEAQFSLQDMCDFMTDQPLDIITCFLYSIHYNDGIEKLSQCIKSIHRALNHNGIFCFNSVDKDKIDNTSFTSHRVTHQDSDFTFSSCWHYSGQGNRQSLKLRIEKASGDKTEQWQDEHPMVAMSFAALTELLQPYFDVHIFEHDYDRIVPWDNTSGNALFVCVKI